MKTREIVEYHQRLLALFERIDEIEDLELKAHWARYLCILSSGFIETSVRAIYSAYARNKAHSNIVNFVEAQLRRFQNPKMQQILNVTRTFNPSWADNLESETEGEIKASIDSIVANRNNIAHGRNVGVSYSQIKSWYENVVKLVDILEVQCDL
ncbi:MAG: HEPN domain-containing protein [Candidatus Poribacteria bacterium]|nr:HEPN domain-containing protein [Candidatus Poribacteria bacterium]